MANPALNENFNENQIKVLNAEYAVKGELPGKAANQPKATVAAGATYAQAEVEAIRTTVNGLIDKLKAAGLMA